MFHFNSTNRFAPGCLLGGVVLVVALATACGGQTSQVTDGGASSASSSGASSGASSSGSTGGSSGGSGSTGGSSGGTSSSNGSTSSSSTGGSSSGSGSGSTSSSSGGPLPPPGSPACDDALDDAGNTACVFCSDYVWHCGNTIIPQCPPGTKQGASCQGWDPPDGDISGGCLVNCPGNQSGLGYRCGGTGKWLAPDPPSCP